MHHGSDLHAQIETTELPETTGFVTTETQRRRPPTRMRRPALYLTVAAAGALLVNVLNAGPSAARADAQLQSVSIAHQLGVQKGAAAGRNATVRPLEQLVASRSERETEQTAAAQAQAAADKAERDKRAAAAAAAAKAKAAAEAAAKAK